MRGSTKLFRIFGIDIKLHFSWWFIFFLLVLALSLSFFPGLCGGEFKEGLFAHEAIPDCQNLSSFSYWFMGTIAALLLFASVLLHELAHSIVAKIKRIKVESITLFFFGGVAGITSEDMKPSSEFLMAIAGPLFSIFLGAVFFLINKFYLNGIVTAITFYLYFINFLLAGFNLIPGFPLDGGRAFRAILHWYYKDLKKATKIAVIGGKLFAGYLVIEGILTFFGLHLFFPGGLWFVFLGGFLYFIAGMSYEQVILREVLTKIKVKELLRKKITTLNPEMRFVDFVKKYSNSEEEVFVVRNKTFQGILDVKRIEKMPLKMQELIKLKQVAQPITQIKSLNKDDHAYTAFKMFAESGLDLLPVKDRGKMLGVVTRKIVMHRLVWGLKYGGEGRIDGRLVKRIERKVQRKKKLVKRKQKKKKKPAKKKKLVRKKQ